MSIYCVLDELVVADNTGNNTGNRQRLLDGIAPLKKWNRRPEAGAEMIR